MKDRVPRYPGRVTMTPVAGKPNTYDLVRADQPVEAGTPLSKATLLPDTVVAKLWPAGQAPANPMVADALGQIGQGYGPPKLLASYTAAGSYTFVVPAGVTKLLVAMIGAGGAGGAGYRNGGTYYNGSGGGSGYAELFQLNVAAGNRLPAVVGAGGSYAGGSGGQCALPYSADDTAYGGVPAFESSTYFMRAGSPNWLARVALYGICPFCCTAGGSGFSNSVSNEPHVVLPNGKLGSAYVYNKTPSKGTDPGCGGANSNSSGASYGGAKGTDGGVFLYDFTGRSMV